MRKLQNRTLKPIGPIEFPKCKYHATELSKVVHNPDEEVALGEDWVNSPALFDTKCIDCSVKLQQSRAYGFNVDDGEVKHGPLCLGCLDKRSAADDAAKAAVKAADAAIAAEAAEAAAKQAEIDAKPKAKQAPAKVAA